MNLEKALLHLTRTIPEYDEGLRELDVRLPAKGNSNSNGARLVHLITTMIKWTRTSRLSIKNALSNWGLIDLIRALPKPS